MEEAVKDQDFCIQGPQMQIEITLAIQFQEAQHRQKGD